MTVIEMMLIFTHGNGDIEMEIKTQYGRVFDEQKQKWFIIEYSNLVNATGSNSRIVENQKGYDSEGQAWSVMFKILYLDRMKRVSCNG